MQAPQKPFHSYKWRWATVTPSEGLNRPDVYLGVIRALRKHEGEAPSSLHLQQALQRVHDDTNSSIDLARAEPNRNLIRNSGQYWKALGLLADSHGAIELTRFGKQVADGEITPVQFASVTITELELPNSGYPSSERDIWIQHGLRIRPLWLILAVIRQLAEFGRNEAYISPLELRAILIPLAGVNSDYRSIAIAINAFRNNGLSITAWPDCAPASNDRRMAREFLLFLDHYGFLRRVVASSNDEEEYILESALFESTDALLGLKPDLDKRGHEEIVANSEEVTLVERARVASSIARRSPGFRKKVMKASGGVCAITGVQLPEVLEAAHIVPAAISSNDTEHNGLCLRSDVHALFDTNHLRIEPDGQIHLTEAAREPHNYGTSLPSRIEIPDYVGRNFLKYRWEYL